ncbi:hypothetical protein [uncultured Thiocystis sp.]|uniref:hypothetical protein n=1 Tax=uncultured Thiocystis sp. TaxID=1202134 RepID=UPI0025D2EE96|nr:hypothetical protein [uncultured Thiocystis sp.]
MTRPMLAAPLLTLLAASSPVLALEAACDPIFKASAMKIAQARWHSVIDIKGAKMEAMKVDGQFFMRIDDGQWQRGPDLDHAETVMLEMMQSGKAKVTNCQDDGEETLEGLATRITRYTIEIAGLPEPASNVTLQTSQDAGLPVRQSSDTTTIRYRYHDIVAPEL